MIFIFKHIVIDLTKIPFFYLKILKINENSELMHILVSERETNVKSLAGGLIVFPLKKYGLCIEIIIGHKVMTCGHSGQAKKRFMSNHPQTARTIIIFTRCHILN